MGVNPYTYAFVSIAIADINGHGRPDIVAGAAVALSTAAGVAVFQSNGDGTFRDPAFYDAAASDLRCIALADFNGDHVRDLVTANNTDDTFTILFSGPPLGPP